MTIKPALTQFNGGEIQPVLEGRIDWQKYNYSAKLCKNFIPTVEGYLKRRGGTHFVAQKRGSGQVSFKIYVVLNDFQSGDVAPTMTINEEAVTLTYDDNDTWVTDTLTYLDGTELDYSISSTGYITKNGIIITNINQDDIELNLIKPSGETATVTFVAPTGATITLNGVEQSSITDAVGTSVTYSVSYSALSASGSFVIEEDKNYYVFLKDGDLYVSDGDILTSSLPINGTLYLPDCKIRYIGVGGGGGAARVEGYYGEGWIAGGSGAGCDVVLNISEGSYSWNVGAVGEDADSLGKNGTSTYISLNATKIVENGAGKGGYEDSWNAFYGAYGGTNTIKNAYVAQTNWKSNGKGSSGRRWESGAYSAVRGNSVYNGYGLGSWGDIDIGTNGYLFISFVED